jgi:hypothetical protein
VSDLSYPECTRELYESEIFGEAVFLALVEVAKTPRDRYHLGTLLQLESETKARMRPLLFGHGVSLDESMELAGVEVALAGYLAVTWQEFMAANIGVVQSFLTRFKEIVAVGTEEDQEVLQSMVHHETAILTWATMEAEGSVQGSLDDVIAQLQYPLPMPAGL